MFSHIAFVTAHYLQVELCVAGMCYFFPPWGVHFKLLLYCINVMCPVLSSEDRGRPFFSHKDVLSDDVYGQRHCIFSFVQNFEFWRGLCELFNTSLCLCQSL